MCVVAAESNADMHERCGTTPSAASAHKLLLSPCGCMEPTTLHSRCCSSRLSQGTGGRCPKVASAHNVLLVDCASQLLKLVSWQTCRRAPAAAWTELAAA